MSYSDDFDAPNTKPGLCPECGMPANIWADISQQWECSFCNWKGRNPARPPPTNYDNLNEVCF